MVEQEIEFRGIPVEHLKMYFEELGAIKLTDSFPYVFIGELWEGEILKEKELTFTSVFKVNAVHIRFKAKTQLELEELIKKYRYKTTRIGG